MKLLSFVVIGGMTLIYVVGELGVAIWLGSLTLLSDGYAPLSLSKSSRPETPQQRETHGVNALPVFSVSR
jgi:hypothetical protein